MRSKFDDHAAIPAAEPLEAVVKDKKNHVQRMLTVHRFAASGHALVLDPSSNRLVRVWEATQTGDVFQRSAGPPHPPPRQALHPRTARPLRRVQR